MLINQEDVDGDDDAPRRLSPTRTAVKDRQQQFKTILDDEVMCIVNSLLVWMLLMLAFVAFIWMSAAVVRDRQWSKHQYFGTMLLVLLALMIWRCLGADWHGSKASWAVGAGVPGLAFVTFGLGVETLLNQHGWKGSIVDAQAAHYEHPTINLFYFNDGFVARHLAVTVRGCWKSKAPESEGLIVHGHWEGAPDYDAYAGKCYHYSLAPVFASPEEAATDVNATVRAWAVPQGYGTLTLEGRAATIPADTCQTVLEEGVGGLCGISATQNVKDHAFKKHQSLLQKFEQKYPSKLVNGSLPSIAFSSPNDEIKVLWSTCVVGFVLVAFSIAITCWEAKLLCEEAEDPRACWLRKITQSNYVLRGEGSDSDEPSMMSYHRS